jgi:hypothetical protein
MLHWAELIAIPVRHATALKKKMRQKTRALAWPEKWRQAAPKILSLHYSDDTRGCKQIVCPMGFISFPRNFPDS